MGISMLTKIGFHQSFSTHVWALSALYCVCVWHLEYAWDGLLLWVCDLLLSVLSPSCLTMVVNCLYFEISASFNCCESSVSWVLTLVPTCLLHFILLRSWSNCQRVTSLGSTCDMVFANVVVKVCGGLYLWQDWWAIGLRWGRQVTGSLIGLWDGWATGSL